MFSSLDVPKFYKYSVCTILLILSYNTQKKETQLNIAFWNSPCSHKVSPNVSLCASMASLMAVLITPHGSNMVPSSLSSPVSISYQIVSFFRRVTEPYIPILPVTNIWYRANASKFC